MDLEEQQILEEIRRGNRPAFSLLYEKYGARLFNTAYRLTGNRDDAEDVLQETCVRILAGIRKYRSESGFYTWAYRILVNTWINFHKKQRSRALLPLPDQLEQAVLNSADAVRHREVQETLMKLSPKLRTVLVLKEVEGLCYREISEILACSEGTVASRLNRARQQFADLYRPAARPPHRDFLVIHESPSLQPCHCQLPGSCGCTSVTI